MTAKTLLEHRSALADNAAAYEFELLEANVDCLVRTLVPHLKAAGYTATPSRPRTPLV